MNNRNRATLTAHFNIADEVSMSEGSFHKMLSDKLEMRRVRSTFVD